MPWDRPETLGHARCSTSTGGSIALRRSSEALARGGIRYAHVGADAIAYLRETRGERLLVPRARAPTTRRCGCRSARSAPAELETAVRRRRAASPAATASLPADGPAFHVWRLT